MSKRLGFSPLFQIDVHPTSSFFFYVFPLFPWVLSISRKILHWGRGLCQMSRDLQAVRAVSVLMSVFSYSHITLILHCTHRPQTTFTWSTDTCLWTDKLTSTRLLNITKWQGDIHVDKYWHSFNTDLIKPYCCLACNFVHLLKCALYFTYLYFKYEK